MKCIILCAGYATRLYPLTLNQPKALLPIKGRPLLDYTLDKIPPEIDRIIVVSNDKFYNSFCSWAVGKNRISVLNDCTGENSKRLGGIGDLNFAINKEDIEDDLLVILGDNIFDFDLGDFIKEFRKKQGILIGLYNLDLEEIKKMSEVRIEGGRIVDFDEKPSNPKTGLASIGIYLFPKASLEKINDYIDTDNPKDGPGFLIQYFCKHSDVYPYLFNGCWFDIGSIQMYEKVNFEW